MSTSATQTVSSKKKKIQKPKQVSLVQFNQIKGVKKGKLSSESQWIEHEDNKVEFDMAQQKFK